MLNCFDASFSRPPNLFIEKNFLARFKGELFLSFALFFSVHTQTVRLPWKLFFLFLLLLLCVMPWRTVQSTKSVVSQRPSAPFWLLICFWPFRTKGLKTLKPKIKRINQMLSWRLRKKSLCDTFIQIACRLIRLHRSDGGDPKTNGIDLKRTEEKNLWRFSFVCQLRRQAPERELCMKLEM